MPEYDDFPSLAKQAAIMKRLEVLMASYREVEAELEHARTHAAHLIQAVLKDAFAPAAELDALLPAGLDRAFKGEL